MTDIELLKEWIIDINYSRVTGRWKARLFPKHIIEVYHFADLLSKIEKHAVNQLVLLAADALEIEPEQLVGKTRKTEITDARIATVFLVVEQMPFVKHKVIANAVGYSNRSTVVLHLQNNRGVKEIENTLDKIYKTHTFLTRPGTQKQKAAEIQKNIKTN